MTSVAESIASPGQLGSVLDAGVQQISRNQTVRFQRYTKSTVPTDGFVFWVAAGPILTVSGSHPLRDGSQTGRD